MAEWLSGIATEQGVPPVSAARTESGTGAPSFCHWSRKVKPQDLLLKRKPSFRTCDPW
jgi:hypothetical protein